MPSISDTLEISTALESLAQAFGTTAPPSLVSPRPLTLLTTGERTPEGFYEDLRARYGPDGYIYGTGMANVLSMVEAFEGTPRGLIVADPDPAVAAASRLIARALARHPEPEGFVEEIFCGRGEGEGLRAEQDGRLWRGLAALTDGFSLSDPRALIAQWAGNDRAGGSAVPVMTYVLRGYPKLHALARKGCFVAVVASPFDPELIEAVRGLPGFAGSSNLLYLADEVTQILRRSLFASARARLRLDATEAPEVRSTADFVNHLNAVWERLSPLVEASRAAVCVYSSEGDDLLLKAEPGIPRFSGDDFYFQFDLDKMVLRFFDTGDGSADVAREPVRGGWREAAAYRATALRLFGAAVRGSEGDAKSALADFELEWARPAGEDDPPTYSAYRIAELGEALWMLRKSALAAPVEEARQLGEAVHAAARRLAARSEDLLRQASGRAKDLLLFAQAFRIAGRLAGDAPLADQAEAFLRAALALRSPDGVFLDQGRDDIRLHAEAVLRLVLCGLHRPAHDTNAAAAQGLARLRPAVRLDGGLDLPPAGGAPEDGYTAHVADDAMVHENARLALLFHGLTNEDLDASQLALRMHFFLGRRGASTSSANSTVSTERG